MWLRHGWHLQEAMIKRDNFRSSHCARISPSPFVVFWRKGRLPKLPNRWQKEKPFPSHFLTIAAIATDGIASESAIGCWLVAGGSQRRPQALQRSTLNVQRSTFNVQPSTFNLQPSTFNLQPSTFNLQPSTHSTACGRFSNSRCTRPTCHIYRGPYPAVLGQSFLTASSRCFFATSGSPSIAAFRPM